jgi:hypothetical protein
MITSSPRTPTRALPSTLLSSHSTPSLPPPLQIYHPLIKAVLRDRLVYRIFPYSVAAVGVVVLGRTAWEGEGGLGAMVKGCFNPGVWGWVGGWWIVGILPVLVTRKVLLNSQFSMSLFCGYLFIINSTTDDGRVSVSNSPFCTSKTTHYPRIIRLHILCDPPRLPLHLHSLRLSSLLPFFPTLSH